MVSLTNGLNKIQIGSDGLTGGMEFDLFPGKPVGVFYSPAPVYTPDGKIVVDPNYRISRWSIRIKQISEHPKEILSWD